MTFLPNPFPSLSRDYIGEGMISGPPGPTPVLYGAVADDCVVPPDGPLSQNGPNHDRGGAP